DSLKFKFYVAATVGGPASADSTSCPFYLWHKDTMSAHIPQFSNITSISDFNVTGNLENGNFENFYFVAHYSLSAFTLILAHDTVWGHSCIPLQKCTACSTPPQQTPVTYIQPAYGNSDSGSGMPRPIFPAKSLKPAVFVPATDYAFTHDSTTVIIPIRATASNMIFDVEAPKLAIDTPFAHIRSIELDSTLTGGRDSMLAVVVGHDVDTIPDMEAFGLDSGRTYYLRVTRYNALSCPVCHDSTSYFGLTYGTPATFVDVNVPLCDFKAYGPNLLYDGDFETVPSFAADAPTCYQVRSPLYPNSAPNNNTIGYPTTSEMRFDSCTINLFGSHDFTNMYYIGRHAGAAPHSGTHYMIIDAPSDSCKSCSLTDTTSQMYTPSFLTIAWHQKLRVTKGTIYRLSAWFHAFDHNGSGTIRIGLAVNDTIYFNGPITFAEYGRAWKANGFCWLANSDSADIKVYALGGHNSFGYDCFMDDIAFQAALPVPCNPPMAFADTTVSPPYTPRGGDACVNQYLQNAKSNALNAYNKYIDSITTVVRASYMSHCLSAMETFTDTYQDKQYHYTLYYYDQAGNLIRTTPPQGVSLFGITHNTDPLELQIIADRTFGQHNVFKNDVLGSTYVYNSLNQLVEQSVPDDDNMQIWNFNLPTGLNSNLVVTGTQFTDAANGYLSGYVPNGSARRGYLYKTHDGGHTWQPMYGTVAANMNAVVMTSAAAGYAVGNDGVVLVTADGG
ncbi:MAG TPA: hypothetical protein VNY36_00555, partial [Bacteroidia bacterium]|nr:hypothetical protein [Bacteroidia bacterium]